MTYPLLALSARQHTTIHLPLLASLCRPSLTHSALPRLNRFRPVFSTSVPKFYTSPTSTQPAGKMAAQYSFPAEAIGPLVDQSRTPLVLISCGSFSPITYLHLRMFEMCKDWIKENTQFEVVGGFLSPVSDAYKKVGLAAARHRIEMCRLAVQPSTWIAVDGWEALKPEYTRTALVLDHFQYEINELLGGVETISGARTPAKISLMSGADLLQTMSEPGVWSLDDLEHILGRYGAFIVERHGTDMDRALESLNQWRSNIYTIPQLIQNDVSSTKIRNFLRKDMSVRYLIPEPALKYLDAHSLFRDDAGRKLREHARSGADGDTPSPGHSSNGV